MTDNGTMLVFIGERKNLRGAKRQVGNVVRTPRGYHFYDGHHWQLFSVPETIVTKAILVKKKQSNNIEPTNTNP